ncbi:MAG: radical SAM protein [Candidatus Brocadiia bacterium]
MRYVFGPVPSRRLGNSLGVDLVPAKTCPYDCVYCQLGRTTKQTMTRQSHAPPDEVVAEVEQAVKAGERIDYITLSGSGEPTLSVDVGQVVRGIKALTSIPVAVLTNGALLWREGVRADLARADLVMPSLDAATQETFEAVNRPLALDAEVVAAGIRDFSLEFDGRVWLEVMVVRGMNDGDEEAKAILHALQGARLDRVQLNTVRRAPAEPSAQPVCEQRLEELAALLAALAPADVIHDYAGEPYHGPATDVAEVILSTLARRPCGTVELAKSLGLEPKVVARHIGELERAGRVERIAVGERTQYRAQGL